MASLRPLTAQEYPALVENLHRTYVTDMVEAGVAADAAEDKWQRDRERLLGAGEPVEGMYALVDGDEAVGHLWIAERPGDLGPSLFVWSVAVDEDRRGRGYGREAMRLAEEEAQARGLAAVELNVFGGNDVAHGLYRSMGYRDVAVVMRKGV
jgi:ribosomal protein S18 acetylase RimI-like enzyme